MEGEKIKLNATEWAELLREQTTMVQNGSTYASRIYHFKTRGTESPALETMVYERSIYWLFHTFVLST